MIDHTYLMGESGLREGSGNLGVVLVVTPESVEHVDRIAANVLTASGTITSAARFRDGGLYTFYFADADGNSW